MTSSVLLILVSTSVNTAVAVDVVKPKIYDVKEEKPIQAVSTMGLPYSAVGKPLQHNYRSTSEINNCSEKVTG